MFFALESQALKELVLLVLNVSGIVFLSKLGLKLALFLPIPNKVFFFQNEPAKSISSLKGRKKPDFTKSLNMRYPIRHSGGF